MEILAFLCYRVLAFLGAVVFWRFCFSGDSSIMEFGFSGDNSVNELCLCLGQ